MFFTGSRNVGARYAIARPLQQERPHQDACPVQRHCNVCMNYAHAPQLDTKMAVVILANNSVTGFVRVADQDSDFHLPTATDWREHMSHVEHKGVLPGGFDGPEDPFFVEGRGRPVPLPDAPVADAFWNARVQRERTGLALRACHNGGELPTQWAALCLRWHRAHPKQQRHCDKANVTCPRTTAPAPGCSSHPSCAMQWHRAASARARHRTAVQASSTTGTTSTSRDATSCG
jgi:hypothetical protein